MLAHAEPHLERNIHPTVICRAYMKALDDAVAVVEKLAFKIDFMDRDSLMKVVDSCIATKFTRRFGTLIPVRTLSFSLHLSLSSSHLLSSFQHRFPRLYCMPT
jgi:TCP-1/cpn60 chaperonin family